MKRIRAAVLILAMSLFWGSCATPVASAEAADAHNLMDFGENRRIIIDSDAGGDDALAILMAAKSPNITIEGVTVLQGNVSLEQAAKNALMVLEFAGCDCGVYPGATTPLDGVERETFSIFGSDEMGDGDLIHPAGKPVRKERGGLYPRDGEAVSG